MLRSKPAVDGTCYCTPFLPSGSGLPASRGKTSAASEAGRGVFSSAFLRRNIQKGESGRCFFFREGKLMHFFFKPRCGAENYTFHGKKLHIGTTNKNCLSHEIWGLCLLSQGVALGVTLFFSGNEFNPHLRLHSWKIFIFSTRGIFSSFPVKSIQNPISFLRNARL